MSQWTVADIPSQTGRRMLITGANSGIGYYAALELARKGAHLLFAVRDRARGEAALNRLRQEVPGAAVDLLLLDVASLASVQRVAAGLLDQGLPLDVLVNNAGIYAPKERSVTPEGFELQFGTNVLGHFALTALLLPLLRKAARPARIVTIASVVHKRAAIDFDDLQATHNYSPSRSYGQSKLANLMLAFELDRRLQAARLPLLSIAAHPGVSNTGIFTKGKFSPVEKAGRAAFAKLFDLFLNSQPSGALPTLYAAVAPKAVSGGYYGPQGFLEARGGDVGPAKIAPQAKDEAAAKRLWNVCEELTGVTLL